MARDTIYAPATGIGQAAIAVIRISGPVAHDVVAGLIRGPLPKLRMLARRDLFDADGSLLDAAMVVIFPEGGSYTGEAMAEVHCHGGRAVVEAVCRQIAALGPCTMAEPGAFTLRAFLAERMDLTEVEGLHDLITAQTELQRKQALRLSQGATSERAEAWRATLIRALALLELTIDWVDEEIPEDVGPEVTALLDTLISDFDRELALSERAEKLRSGFEVALVGAPNVGKSTLLNALAGREAAITSDIAGTTRDVMEVALDLEGLPVRFLDMAGLRLTDDPIEKLGVRRAMARAAGADLRVFLSCDGIPVVPERDELYVDGDMDVATKADVGVVSGVLGVSAKSGEGVDELLAQILGRFAGMAESGGVLTHRRHVETVGAARLELCRVRGGLASMDTEVLCEHMRHAAGLLDHLLGRIGTEDVLGAIFSEFCLGK